MASKARNMLSGRTTLAALLCLMIAVTAGCFALIRRAEAQTPAAAVKPVSYGPLGMTPLGYYYASYLTVSNLLPAVPHATTPFRVEALSDGATVSMEIPQALMSSSRLWVYFKADSHGVMKLWIQNPYTGEKHSAVAGTAIDSFDVAVQVHPATEANGKQTLPLASSMVFNGVDYEYTEDDFQMSYDFYYGVSPGA